MMPFINANTNTTDLQFEDILEWTTPSFSTIYKYYQYNRVKLGEEGDEAAQGSERED